ncbi:transcriptional regulator, PadR family [Sporolactobacillus inulinus]|uniref:Transcriptional regulator, PadR family n=1 Tax=Sporolactobacillus inulinus TaxID=2078 RepID=A0A4Y1ZIR0_9BACL|nr:transcriptional regulator, PadR family [Sporolactobacillus inulinus]
MNVQFKKGVLELCVLVLIDGRDQYGYELAQNISKKLKWLRVHFIRCFGV